VDKLAPPAGTRQDRAEDVFGGLDTMLSFSWHKVGTKVNIEKWMVYMYTLAKYQVYIR
jgi:hypothetical protein